MSLRIIRTSLFIFFFYPAILSAQGGSGGGFTFLEKARQHYRDQELPAGSASRGQPAIDSLLKLDSATTDFNKAYNLTWRIGLFLLEKGKHAAALNLYNDLRVTLEAKKDQTRDDKIRISSVLNVIGAIYEETGLWNEALGLYMKSLQVCNETGFSQGQAKVYNNLGKIYFNRNEFHKAEELFNKAIQINKSLNNRSELFNNYNNLAGIYQQRKDLRKALEYAIVAMSQLDIERDFFDLGIVYMNIGSINQDMGNYTVALSYFQQAAMLQEEKSFHVSLVGAYLSIADLYDVMNQAGDAEEYLRKAVDLALRQKNPTLELSVLMSAAKHYKMKDPERSLYYYDRYVKLNDSLTSLNSLTRIEQIQAVYDVISKEKDNQILSQKVNLQELALQRQRIVLLAAILIFLLLGFLIFYLQRNRKLERKRSRLIAMQAESLHQKEKEILLQEEQNLKLELDYKNRQLTSYALHLARNNEFITRTTDELKQILLELNPRDKERAERIRHMLSELQQYSTGNDWEEFRLYFEEVHQSFEKNLTENFPDLSTNDKKICALIKLGLTTKDIASITFRELRSVESARNRLRKKLGLGTDTNIQSFLSQY